MKTLLKWTLIALLVLLAGGTAYEKRARAIALANHPPSGEMFAVDGLALHLDCRGEGWPTVVLESGMDPYGSLAWTLVHDDLARLTRVCAYDRAGIAWSELADSRRDAHSIARELSGLLAESGVEKPFVLAGHSMGGVYALSFAADFPDDLAGLALLESSHPKQFERLPDMGQVPPRFLMATLPMLRSVGLARLVMRSELQIRSIPEAQRVALQSVSASSIATVAQEYMNIEASMAKAAEVRTLGDLPLLVMAVGNAPDASRIPGFTQQQADRAFATWTELQREHSRLSSDSTWVPVPQATHYLQFSQPEAVIAALSEFVVHVRSATAASAGRTPNPE